jgi:hypothetical protein
MIATLDQDANLIYLLLHGSKHMWERLEWIVDIDRLVRQMGDQIDWTRLEKLAVDMEIEVMFNLGIAMVYEFFATPVPLMILEKIKTNEKVQAAKTFILDEILDDAILIESTKSTAFKNLYKMRLNKDSRMAIARHYWMTLTGLKYFDVYMVNLPNSLSFLYHPLRLYRLFKFYILRSQ